VFRAIVLVGVYLGGGGCKFWSAEEVVVVFDAWYEMVNFLMMCMLMRMMYGLNE